jgi:nitrate reductase / nitrite oxidoreductase, beta subunit
LTVGDVTVEVANRMLAEAGCSPEEAEAIYQLTSLCTFEDRFVIPPMHREEALQMMKDPMEHKADRPWLGSSRRPQRPRTER